MILKDETGGHLQEVLTSVETGQDLEIIALEEAIIETDLSLQIERDLEEDLTLEDGEMIMIDHDHLEIYPDVLDVPAKTARW